MREIDRYVHFSYGQRSKAFEESYHYKEINLEEVALDKPTVFFFGGTGTDSDMQLNAYLKLVENLLGEFAPDADIIGMHYNYIDPEDTETIDRNIDEFIKTVLFKHIQKDGAVLDVKEVCKKLRNITIFGHCFGKSLAEKMVVRLEGVLENIGYSKKDCAEIASQIFIISHAAEPSAKKSHAKCLSVVSPLDTMIDDNDYAWRLLLQNLNQVQMSLDDRAEIKKLIEKYGKRAKREIHKFYQNNPRVFAVQDKDEIYLASSIPLDKYWWEHALYFASRNEEYKAKDRTTEVGDYVSKCLLCALCNSVANSILNNKQKDFTPFELDYLKSQLEDFLKYFNNKETIPCDSKKPNRR